MAQQRQPNTQLEAALIQFGRQSVVSPNQEAQLRAAITSDAKLLRELNQTAREGHLQGFALPDAGSTNPNHVGQYDLQTGVVTLPATAFQPNGTAPSTDLKAVLQVQEMTIRFGHGTYPVPTPPGATMPPAPQPVSQDMLDNLQATLNGSPVLAEQVKKAASTRDTSPSASGMLLENFGFLGPGISAGGTYAGDKHTMNLPALGLQTRTSTNPQGRFDADDMTFVIGHEIQHGFNHPGKTRATTAFNQRIKQIAETAAVVHDYSAPTRAYIQAGREDEAKAEIAGWNALLSRQQQLNPNANLATMYGLQTTSRQLDFISKDPVTQAIAPNQGLTFNPDNTISQSPANITAMGQHYFNRPDPVSAQVGQRPVHLGESGRTDYTNYYGTWAVEQITHAERQHARTHPGVTHRLTLDMAGIGLKENLMEQEGIDIRIDKATPQPYFDSSQTPAAPGNFHHTQDGSVNPQHDHQYVPIGPTQHGGPTAPHQPPAADPMMAPGLSGPFDDPYLNRTRAALITGNSDELDRIATEFSQTPEGQRMAQMGDQLLAQHQEQQRSQEQEQARQHPAMRM